MGGLGTYIRPLVFGVVGYGAPVFFCITTPCLWCLGGVRDGAVGSMFLRHRVRWGAPNDWNIVILSFVHTPPHQSHVPSFLSNPLRGPTYFTSTATYGTPTLLAFKSQAKARLLCDLRASKSKFKATNRKLPSLLPLPPPWIFPLSAPARLPSSKIEL